VGSPGLSDAACWPTSRRLEACQSAKALANLSATCRAATDSVEVESVDPPTALGTSLVWQACSKSLVETALLAYRPGDNAIALDSHNGLKRRDDCR